MVNFRTVQFAVRVHGLLHGLLTFHWSSSFSSKPVELKIHSIVLWNKGVGNYGAILQESENHARECIRKQESHIKPQITEVKFLKISAFFYDLGGLHHVWENMNPVALHQDVRCGGGSEQQKQQELGLIPPLPRCFGETGFGLSRSHDECTRNQLVNHLLKDQEEDPKEAKTRVPLKQLRRKQKLLVKSDPEADPENGQAIPTDLGVCDRLIGMVEEFGEKQQSEALKRFSLPGTHGQKLSAVIFVSYEAMV
ncbi:hypothetical protein WISP_57162 [Willisornis vidua]|uniref:Uncharacterized protein n=1 Tax=Willisornis vidua TaxID=1566151 RepID=A0ABQ9DBS6_9PASS|nr:hypothetical protein WISP_57162 [Willisornis vidua]